MKVSSLSALLATSLGLSLTLYGPQAAQAASTVEAYYRLGEDGLGADSSGNGRNLADTQNFTVATSSPPSSSNPPGNQFTSSTAYAFLPSGMSSGLFGPNGFQLPTDNFGIEIFVRPDVLNQTSTIFVSDTGVEGQGVEITYDGNNLEGRGPGYFAAISGVAFVGGVKPASTSMFASLALVRDNGVSTFYFNGVADAATSSSAPGVPDASAFSVAVRPQGGSQFSGSLDELRLVTFDAGEFDPQTDLLFNAVPEPSSIAAMLAGAAVLGVFIMVRGRRQVPA